MGECKHLDNKHSVFGEIIGGLPLIHKFNVWETNFLDKPQPEIKIIETIVIENPFRDVIKEIEEEKEKGKNGDKDQQLKKEFWLEKDDEGFRLPENKKNKLNEDSNFGSGLTKLLIDSNQLQEKEQTIIKQKQKKN